VLFATSEVEEVLHAADRIVVLSRGRVAGEFDPRTTTREEVMAASGESLDSSTTSGGDRT
jgi:erythritol transport system ATP-binding protein